MMRRMLGTCLVLALAAGGLQAEEPEAASGGIYCRLWVIVEDYSDSVDLLYAECYDPDCSAEPFAVYMLEEAPMPLPQTPCETCSEDAARETLIANEPLTPDEATKKGFTEGKPGLRLKSESDVKFTFDKMTYFAKLFTMETTEGFRKVLEAGFTVKSAAMEAVEVEVELVGELGGSGDPAKPFAFRITKGGEGLIFVAK